MISKEILLSAVSNHHHTMSETMSTANANIANIPQLIALARAARTDEERRSILHQIHHARAFEALVVKHGSVEAANRILASLEAEKATHRARELASM